MYRPVGSTATAVASVMPGGTGSFVIRHRPGRAMAAAGAEEAVGVASACTTGGDSVRWTISGTASSTPATSAVLPVACAVRRRKARRRPARTSASISKRLGGTSTAASRSRS